MFRSHPFFRGFCFSPDSDAGAPVAPATPATPEAAAVVPAANGNGAGTSSASEQPRTFTQEELNRITGEVRTTTRAKALTDFVGELKFDDPEKLKAYLQSARERDQASLTEAEKLQARLTELEKAAADSEASKKTLAAYETAVTAEAESLIKELSLPDYVTDLLTPMSPLQKLEYLTKNRAAFAKPTPAAPNLNGGSKGGSKSGDETLSTVRAKYGIRRYKR